MFCHLGLFFFSFHISTILIKQKIPELGKFSKNQNQTARKQKYFFLSLARAEHINVNDNDF